jgi:hypothetical protein
MKEVIIIVYNFILLKCLFVLNINLYRRFSPFACHSKFRFLGARLGIDFHTVAILRAEGKSDAWPSGWRTQYLNVVFVLSKLVINA